MFIWDVISVIKYTFIHVIQGISGFGMGLFLPREWVLLYFFYNTETFQDCIFLVIYAEVQNYILKNN